MGPPHNVSLMASSVLVAVDMDLFPACTSSSSLEPRLPLSSFLATPASVFPSQPASSRPVYTCCFPSSPPISPPTHCFLTRSSPSNGSRSAGIAHRPCRLKKRRLRTPRPPAQGPHAAQREDPTLPSARTLRRPARGPYDTLQPSWIRPKSSSGFLRGTLDTRKQTTCPQDPPTVNPSTATGTPCTFPVGHAGPKTLDPGLPSSRETHLLTDELH
ncbi:uncharacterized protein LOC116080970 isoform X4 [Mastomys coucha]|uniref:uncharacterized protein LOC116080970 isoform X4 n=1 Tax=Mastomys coucha TaxID=35658 RepID=UPI001262138A|nr:uncharacterized protein LOC116080970 isoform X4 [Mastomys coucha]